MSSSLLWLVLKNYQAHINATTNLLYFTPLAVADTSHFIIPGFTWPLAFVLGAEVSPPDAVAASGIIKGLGLNKKVITILEGESLVNDASALITYRYAVMAVTTGTFVFWKAGIQFLLVSGVGIFIGLLTGYIFSWMYKRIDNNPVVVTSLTLLTPFLAYLSAEHFHMSGILAVVKADLFVSQKSHEVFASHTRMRTRAIWYTLIFLMHGCVFIMIGLQLPTIVKNMGNYPIESIIGYGLTISLVTIVVRIILVFAGAHWQDPFGRKKKSIDGTDNSTEKDDTWKNVLVVAWTGTRGVISLAAAMALPLVLLDGTAFPKRFSIIFLAFIVIFVTLVVQGLSLPLLIRWLHIKSDDDTEEVEKELQLMLANSTLQFIEKEFPVQGDDKLQQQLKIQYAQQSFKLTKELNIYKKVKYLN